jgi:hypothetical protein
MEEKRKLERFDLTLPAKIAELGREKGVQHNLLTKNICAGGAFFETKKHFLTENARVSIDLAMPTGAQIKITGTVLRSEPAGVAIRFNNEYKIIPLIKSSRESDKSYKNFSPIQ